MKKFSQINESNTTVELSTNKKDFINNLINESLTVEGGEIKGKDTLAKAINKILEVNDSKTVIRVLENVKARSYRTFSFEWINEAIVAEKKKIDPDEKCEGCGEIMADCTCAPKEKMKKEKVVESLNESHIDKLDEFEEEHEDTEHEESEHEEHEEIEEQHDDIKTELEEIKDIQLEILDKLEGGSPADGFVDPDEDDLAAQLEEEEECEENCEDEEECQECQDMFVEESASYLKDIRDLKMIMESINNGLITEDHLESKDEQLDYILSRFGDKKVEKVVLENISSLPTYVKTADIEETLKNLSDVEVKKLYLEVEKVK